LPESWTSVVAVADVWLFEPVSCVVTSASAVPWPRDSFARLHHRPVRLPVAR
jgi:hypothetical protein